MCKQGAVKTAVAPNGKGVTTLPAAERGRKLHFAIRFYKAYTNNCWSPFYADKADLYGEIRDGTGCCGDRDTTAPLQNGYVYIIKGSAVAHAFAVADGVYQPIQVTASDLSHSKKLGPARPYMVIKDFFPTDEGQFSDDHYVVVSSIKLSAERLFKHKAALTKTPGPRATRMSVSRRRLDEAYKDNRSGPQILADYRRGKSSPDIVTYNYTRQVFDGVEGFNLLIPDIAGEARRRNTLYRDRLAKYQVWFNGDQRSQEVFLAQAVHSIVAQDKSMQSYVNQAKLDEWTKTDSEAYRQYFFPVHYAIESLLFWLTQESFKALLLDYNLGTDEDQNAGQELYGDAIRDIHYTEAGAKLLEKEYDDKDSYFNQTTRLLALKPKYSDPSAWPNFFFEVRKWSNVGFAVLEEFVAVIVAKEREGARELILELVYKKTKYRLPITKVRPIPVLDRWVTVFDVNQALGKLAEWPETKSGRGVITFVEGANVALAIWGITQSTTPEEKAKAGVNTVGAVLDFLSSNWVMKGACDRLAKSSGLWGRFGSTVITRMVVISGIIDVALGLWEIKLAYQRAEYDVILGWGVFALGGALIAYGTATAAAGAKIAVGSGGVAAKPGVGLVVIGLITEAVGLLLVYLLNNNEVENWLTQSHFGRKPGGKSLRDQLQDLNDILCKFEVAADFVDLPGKFDNTTVVTLKIKTRVITDESTILLSGMQGYAHARVGEMLSPFSNTQDLREGMEGLGSRTLEIGKLSHLDITRKNGRITEVRTTIVTRMDTDELKGRAELKLNNGTLQGYSRDFAVAV